MPHTKSSVAKEKINDLEKEIVSHELDIQFLSRKISKISLEGGREQLLLELTKNVNAMRARIEQINKEVIPFLKEHILE